MSKAQKERFERIKSRYSAAFQKQAMFGDGANLKVARPAMVLPKLEWRPAIRLHTGTGMVSSGLSRQPDKLSCHPEGAKRPKDLSTSLTILGGWSPQSLSYGAMAAITGRRIGAYVKGRSNFKDKIPAAYSCQSDGTSGGAPIWTTGKESHTVWTLGVGGIIRSSNVFSLYAGSGYGLSETLWEDAAGKWAKVDDYSAKGICADAGIIFTKSYFQASTGISAISLKNPTLEIGLGFRF